MVSRLTNGSQKAQSKLKHPQLLELRELLAAAVECAEAKRHPWSHADTARLIQERFSVTLSPRSIPRVLHRMSDACLHGSGLSVFRNDFFALYKGDACKVVDLLPDNSVDCIVTSPPYYGQRDYQVPGQIGLERHPQEYIDRLMDLFRRVKRLLKPTGSLWVNLGDTYWSGKGRPCGPDKKQRNRRFLRPQDRSGPRPLCAPKQQLLIPHRFAIAMQDDGWIVRNDNVWYKENPTPDPARDRSASAHEYMFHFVQQRRYFYNFDAVAVPSDGDQHVKSPPSVWTLRSKPSFKKHIAVFPESLVRIPVLATLPPGGVILDPFCGSGTALGYAVGLGDGRRAIGIDISESALAEATALMEAIRPVLPDRT